MKLRDLVYIAMFTAIPLLFGWLAVVYLQDIEMLTLVSSQILYLTFLYTIPLGFSFRVISSLRGLLGHKALSAELNKELGLIVVRRQKEIYELIALYVSAALVTVVWKFVSSHAVYVAISFCAGVFSIVLMCLSIVTLWKLKRWDFEVTELLADLSTKERKNEELAKEREARLKALELLTKDDDFSPEMKLAFSRVRGEVKPARATTRRTSQSRPTEDSKKRSATSVKNAAELPPDKDAEPRRSRRPPLVASSPKKTKP